MTDYALPGLMPVGSPKADNRLVSPWEHRLSLVLLVEPASAAEKSCIWWASLQGAGGMVLRQRGANNILTSISNGLRTYALNLLPRSLPPGTHLFEADIGGELVTKRVTVPRTLANGLRRWTMIETEAVGLPHGTFNRLLLYNSETGSYYMLGVVGQDDQARLELGEV